MLLAERTWAQSHNLCLRLLEADLSKPVPCLHLAWRKTDATPSPREAARDAPASIEALTSTRCSLIIALRTRLASKAKQYTQDGARPSRRAQKCSPFLAVARCYNEMFQGRGPTGSAGLRGALLGTVAIRCLAHGFVKQLPICLPCDTVSICASTTKRQAGNPVCSKAKATLLWLRFQRMPQRLHCSSLHRPAGVRAASSCFQVEKGLEKL